MNGFQCSPSGRRPLHFQKLTETRRKNIVLFIEKPRQFIDIFINSLGPEWAESLRHHTRIPNMSTDGKCG